jgi:reactive intermediate/imine deaminase
MLYPLLSLLALAPLAAVLGADERRIQRVPSPPLSGRALPFCQSVRYGDLLFVSGQMGHLPGKMELAPGGVSGETRQAMENMREALANQGATFADVLKVTVMLADMDDWPAMNAVYLEYFAADALPARSAFGASGLALGGRIEIECIARAPR